jgi:tetratricopeptide (TPR) repeat protein
VPLNPGTYILGPQNARLEVKTGRRGMTARAAQDLVIEVRQWNATLCVGADPVRSTVELTADAASLHVVSGTGGFQPLTAKDKSDIHDTIDRQVLLGRAITFRSTTVTRSGLGLGVTGLLAIGAREHSIGFIITDDGASIAARAELNQRDWGIKPHSVHFGALKINDELTVQFEGDVGRGVSSPVPPPAQDKRLPVSSPLASVEVRPEAEGPVSTPLGVGPRATSSPSRSTDGQEAKLRDAARRGDLDAALELGEILLRHGDVDMAQNAFEWVQSKGNVRGSLKLAALMEDHRRDLAGAEAAWRAADDAGDLNGAANLGRLLREKGDLRGAEAAFHRSVERGSLRAAIDYAGLVSMRRDATPAEIADAAMYLCEAEEGFVLHDDGMLMGAPLVFTGLDERCDARALERGIRRADERGSATGALCLGLILRRRGEPGAALPAYRRAVQRGEPEGWAKAAEALLVLGDIRAAEATAREGEAAGAASASTMLGMILDQKGDTDGGLEAYRRADAAGEPFGSMNMGIELRNRGDLPGAAAALRRAVENGASNAEPALADVLRRLGARRA